jgi:polyhydroxybutyrate depolymerase
VPLVLNFHGGQGSALDQLLISGMNAKSNSSGFIVVYPDGYGNTQTWNGGGCCGEARFYNIDDVQFTRQILDEMQAEFCIDTDRIFACGHSNGGIMSYRLACELSDRIAAVGSVGGGIGDVNPSNGIVYYTCAPSRAVPIMHIHGMQDLCYPFAGGYGAGISNTDFVSIPHTIEDWRLRNGCGLTTVQTYSNATASCISYRQGCTDGAEVVLCTDTDAGHSWLGSSIYPSGALCGGVTTTAIVSNDMLWDFFTQHPMP